MESLELQKRHPAQRAKLPPTGRAPLRSSISWRSRCNGNGRQASPTNAEIRRLANRYASIINARPSSKGRKASIQRITSAPSSTPEPSHPAVRSVRPIAGAPQAIRRGPRRSASQPRSRRPPGLARRPAKQRRHSTAGGGGQYASSRGRQAARLASLLGAATFRKRKLSCPEKQNPSKTAGSTPFSWGVAAQSQPPRHAACGCPQLRGESDERRELMALVEGPWGRGGCER